MKGFSHESTDFLAVFLLTMLIAVESLSLLLVWRMGLLSVGVLWLSAGCMALKLANKMDTFKRKKDYESGSADKNYCHGLLGKPGTSAEI